MRIRLGDIVSSEFGEGPVVAMSREWCIHEDESKNEFAVEWEDVKVSVVPSSYQSKMNEFEIRDLIEEKPIEIGEKNNEIQDKTI